MITLEEDVMGYKSMGFRSAEQAKAMWMAATGHSREYVDALQEGGWRGWYLWNEGREHEMVGPFKTGKAAIEWETTRP